MPSFEAGAKKNNINEQAFTFYKRKQLGTVTYKQIKTVVKVTTSQLMIEQVVKKAFHKEKHTEIESPFSTIGMTTIHTVLDFWDGLYAVAFAVLGVFRPVLFLMAALCFWSGYGKEIRITLLDGNVIKIPLSIATEESKILLELCQREQKNGASIFKSKPTHTKVNIKVFAGTVAVLVIVVAVVANLLRNKSNNVLQDDLTLEGEYIIALDAALEDTANDSTPSADSYCAVDLVGLSIDTISQIYGDQYLVYYPEGDPAYIYYEIGCPFTFIPDELADKYSVITEVGGMEGAEIANGVCIGDPLEKLEKSFGTLNTYEIERYSNQNGNFQYVNFEWKGCPVYVYSENNIIKSFQVFYQ